MPKQKTNSGAKKRFKLTGSGKIKRAKAFKRHLLGRKSKKRKEELGKSAIVFKGDEVQSKEDVRHGVSHSFPVNLKTEKL